MAAHRGGIKHVILPARNEKDLNELPDEVRHDLSFTFAKHVRALLFLPCPPQSFFICWCRLQLRDVFEVVFDKGGPGDDDMAIISQDGLHSNSEYVLCLVLS